MNWGDLWNGLPSKYRRVCSLSRSLDLSPAKPKLASSTANLCKNPNHKEQWALNPRKAHTCRPRRESGRGQPCFGGEYFYGMVVDKHQILIRTPTANPAANPTPTNGRYSFMIFLLMKSFRRRGCLSYILIFGFSVKQDIEQRRVYTSL